MTDFDADDETRRLLGAADPARSLPPADADALTTILEDTMSQPTNEPARRTLPRLALLGGAAAAVLAVAIAVPVALNGNDDKADPGSTSTPVGTGTPPADSSVTALTSGPAIAAKCAMPSPADVATQSVAFEGTVTDISDGVVTLTPTHFYAGKETGTVTVTEPDKAMSEMPVAFEVGQAYVVGASDGRVSICGLSGPATDDLRALYEKAFAK